MFTGLITDIGKVKSKSGNTLSITTNIQDLKIGDSVCVNGVCLTVVNRDSNSFSANLLTETLKKTNLGKLVPGDPVNLELPLKVGDRLGGHIVTGHVDCTGKLIRRYKKGNDIVVEIEIPITTSKNLIPKGSIAVNGVSLTIVKIMRNRFTAHLIPYTLEHTNLNQTRIVNIELDKYSRA